MTCPLQLTEANAIEAWHFLRADRKTQFKPREVVKAGSVLSVDGKPMLCYWGLHASVRPIDALNYAPGPVACRVKVWGDVVQGDDKLVGTHRSCIAMVDATNALHEFACCVAEAALLLADVTDERSWKAIEAKRAWLRGEISDRDLAAAWDAAWDAAVDAARDAAVDAASAAARAAASAAARDAAVDAASAAARAAAWDAASAAARAAASAAASAAAWDAARAAAWDAASAAARAAAWDAARAAASAAAWDAAWAEQNATLEAMLLEIMK